MIPSLLHFDVGIGHRLQIRVCFNLMSIRIPKFSSSPLTKFVEHRPQDREQLLFRGEAGAPAGTHVLDTSGEGTPLRPRLACELHHEGFVDRQARNFALLGCWRRPIAIGPMRCHMVHIYRQARTESITRCGKVLGNFREAFCPSHGGLPSSHASSPGGRNPFWGRT
jgi:hypothetical protein